MRNEKLSRPVQSPLVIAVHSQGAEELFSTPQGSCMFVSASGSVWDKKADVVALSVPTPAGGEKGRPAVEDLVAVRKANACVTLPCFESNDDGHRVCGLIGLNFDPSAANVR